MHAAIRDTVPAETPLESSLLWNILQIETGKELRAGRHLNARGVRVYIPTYSQIRRWKDHKPEPIDRALFPGYAFAVFDSPRTQALALQSPGVYNVLTIGRNEPALLDQVEMERIRAIGLHQGEPWQNLEPGQKVRVLDGPFAGVDGLLVRRRNSLRFVISIAMLGRSASVEVDGWALEGIE